MSTGMVIAASWHGAGVFRAGELQLLRRSEGVPILLGGGSSSRWFMNCGAHEDTLTYSSGEIKRSRFCM